MAKQRKRKSAEDYSKEYATLQDRIVTLDIRISNRLSELVKNFPDAVIAQNGDTSIKAKTLSDSKYVASLDVFKRIDFIKAIEDWNLQQQGIVQTTIEF